MTLQQLAFFSEIVKELNFTKAAENLYTSQSSLSHTISALEDELGVKLFVRGRGKSAVLSKFGEILAPFANNALSSIDAGVNEIAAAKENDVFTISISHSHSVASIYIAAVINAYYEKNGVGGIYFHRDVNHIGYSPIPELLEGKTDLVIAAEPSAAPELESIPVAKQQLYVLVHKWHTLASRASIRLRELDGESFSMIRANTDLNNLVFRLLEQEGVSPAKVNMCTDWGSMVATISTNSAVSVTPRLGMCMDLMKHIPLDHPCAQRRLYMIVKKGNRKQAMLREFIDFCVEYAKTDITV